jgi:ubiquinone/menaquinone biosynthesis C-methylase UbiE
LALFPTTLYYRELKKEGLREYYRIMKSGGEVWLLKTRGTLQGLPTVLHFESEIERFPNSLLVQNVTELENFQLWHGEVAEVALQTGFQVQPFTKP